MDFSLFPEQQELQRRFARLAETELAGSVIDRDCDAVFSRELWKRCSPLLGVAMPPEFGGEGRPCLDAALAFEAVAAHSRDQGLLFGLGAQVWSVQIPLLRFGTGEQKRQYLPKLISGELLGCHGMTEAASGSDAFALKTTATFDPRRRGYVVNGEKTLITGAPEAGMALVFATIDASKGRWGVTAFLVNREMPGVQFGCDLPRMGLRTAALGSIQLREVFVPEAARLGEEGSGASIFEHSMKFERTLLMASHIGAMQRQLQDCLKESRRRTRFGVTIDKHESVSNRLAGMKLRLEISRLLLYHAAWSLDAGGDPDLAAAMTKLYCSEAFVASSLDAIRIHGGAGYLTHNEVERDLRDAVGSLLYSGTSDIQKLIIANRIKT